LWVDPVVLRHTIIEPRSEQEAWMALQRTLGGWPLLGFGMWALELKASAAFVGEAGFMEARRPITPDKRGVPELGYVLATPYHGRGLMTEALGAVHGWLARTLPRVHSFALIDDDNPASIRVAGKFGYILERRADTGDRRSGLYARSPGAAP